MNRCILLVMGEGAFNPLKLLESLKVKLLVLCTWKLSRATYLNSMALFSATEADTVWQLVHGIEKVTDPAMRAEVFAQILEEDHHAAEFKRIFDLTSRKPMANATYEREYLYRDSDEVWKLFAYCYVGEDEATDRFRSIASVVEEGPLKEVLKAIIQDESGHVHKAHRLLKTMGISDGAIRREVLKIKLKRKYEHWVRSGRRLAGLPSMLLVSACYFLIGPFCVLPARQRIADRLFLNSP